MASDECHTKYHDNIMQLLVAFQDKGTFNPYSTKEGTDDFLIRKFKNFASKYFDFTFEDLQKMSIEIAKNYAYTYDYKYYRPTVERQYTRTSYGFNIYTPISNCMNQPMFNSCRIIIDKGKSKVWVVIDMIKFKEGQDIRTEINKLMNFISCLGAVCLVLHFARHLCRLFPDNIKFPDNIIQINIVMVGVIRLPILDTFPAYLLGYGCAHNIIHYNPNPRFMDTSQQNIMNLPATLLVLDTDSKNFINLPHGLQILCLVNENKNGYSDSELQLIPYGIKIIYIYKTFIGNQNLFPPSVEKVIILEHNNTWKKL